MALNDAMNLPLKFKIRNINIYSNSLSTLLALKNKNLSLKINKYIWDIKNKFIKFQKNTKFNIKFFLTPAHRGISGNEQVDKLAKIAAQDISLDISKIPCSDLHHEIKMSARIETAKSIVNAPTGKSYLDQYY